MWSAPKSCNAAGCGKATVQGSRYCEAHAATSPPSRYGGRHKDAVDRLYDKAMWKRFRAWILAQRPICQRINKGERCRFTANTVHHLESPRSRPDLFTEPDNVLALCAGCHPGGDAGTPHWRRGHEYEYEQVRPSFYEAVTRIES